MTNTNSSFSTRSGNEWGFDVLARATRQAAMWTVRMTTKKGNLSMANATRKRLALAVVTALGAGLLSAAPASAAVAITSVKSYVSGSTTQVVTRATSSTQIDLKMVGTDLSGSISAKVASRPAAAVANDVEVGDVFSNSFSSATAGTVTVGASKGIDEAAYCGPDGNDVEITAVDVNPANIKITTATAHNLTVGESVELQDNVTLDDTVDFLFAAASERFTVTSIYSATAFFVANTTNWGDMSSYNTVGTPDLQRVGYSAATVSHNGQSVAGANVGDSIIYATQSLCNGTLRGFDASVTNDYFTTAGTYTFTVWIDTDSDGVIDVTETKKTTVTVIVGGTPTTVEVKPYNTTLTEDLQTEVWYYVKDADGNPTRLLGSDQLNFTFTSDGATDDSSFDAAEDMVSGKTYYSNNVYWDGSNINASFVMSAQFGGSLAAMSAAVKTTFNVVRVTYLAALGLKTTVGVTSDNTKYAAVRPILNNDEDGSQTTFVYADPLIAKKLTFTLTGLAGSYVNVGLDSAVGTIAADNAFGTLPSSGYVERAVMIGASGTADITVTATTPVTDDGYCLYAGFKSSEDWMQYCVTYKARAVSETSIDVAELPNASVTKVLTPTAGTTSFTVTVADQYGNKYSNYTVRLETDDEQRNAEVKNDGVTNTDGTATVSFKDAGTTGTDAVTLKVFGTEGPTELTPVVSRDVTVTYGTVPSTGATLSGFGGTTTAKECKVYVAGYGARYQLGGPSYDATTGYLYNPYLSTNYSCTTDSLTSFYYAGVPFTAAIRDAAGLLISGYAVKVTPVTAGLRFVEDIPAYDAAVTTQYFAADGNDDLVAFAAKTGVNEFKISIGSLSYSLKFTAVSTPTFARKIVLTPSATTVAPGQNVRFDAVVTDGFGNAVPGVFVNFKVTKGSSASPQVSVATDANGAASISAYSTAAGEIEVGAELALDVCRTQFNLYYGGPANPLGASCYPAEFVAQWTYAAGFPVASFAAGVGSATAKATASGLSDIEKAQAEAAKATAEAAKATAAAEAAKAAAVAEAAKATAEAAKATAAIAAVSATVTGIQTAISTLVASTTATLTALTAKINKIMKKLKI